MTDRVTVNRDFTKILPAGAPEKGFRITVKEAVELGLLKSAEKAPPQERRRPFNGPLSAAHSEPKPPQRRTTKR